MRAAEKWARVCKRGRWAIIAAWCLVCVPGLVCLPKLTSVTTTRTPEAGGSPSAHALHAFRRVFPKEAQLQTELLAVRTVNGSAILAEPLRTKLQLFSGFLQMDLAARFPSSEISTRSYVSLEPLVPQLVGQLIGKNGDAFGIMMRFKKPATQGESRAFVTGVRDAVKVQLEAQGLADQVSVTYTGWTPGVLDVVDGVNKDIHHVHMYTIPIVLCILAYAVGSLSLVLIPCIALPVTLICQSSIMYPVALKLIVSSFTPILTVTLATALCVDYTLFMLSSFMAGLKRGLTFDSAVHHMVASAGYTVLVSGSTLCVSFLGLLMLPMVFMQTLGLAFGTAAVMCMLVNLSLVPALLFALGEALLKVDNFLANLFFYRWNGRVKGAGPNPTRRPAEEDTEMKTEPPIGAPPSPNNALPHGDAYYDYTMEPGVWLWLARLITSPKRRWISWVALAAVVALAMPVIVQVPKLQPSIDVSHFLPYQSSQYVALKDVKRLFHGDLTASARLLMMADPSKLPEGLISPKGWESMTTVVETLARDVRPFSLRDVMGMVAFSGQIITYEEMLQSRNLSNSYQPGSVGFALRVLTGASDASVISKDGMATQYMIIPQTLMFTQEGEQWVEDVRAVLNKLETQLPLDLHMQVSSAVPHDHVNTLSKRFPVAMAVTLVLVFALLGLFLRSVVAPLRSVVSILLTLTFTYGAAVMVYQQGVLNWTGIRALSSVGGICWNNVFMCCSIIVGLALDYDVFLVTCVLEFRMAGYSDKDALVRAMNFTGRIITAAGLIMFVAFSGLLGSRAMLLNQYGFLLCVAVLLDTFVVRALVVPVLMDVTGRYTWWPRRLPEVKELPASQVSGKYPANTKHPSTHT